MILEINNVSIEFKTHHGNFPAIQNASFSLKKGEIFAIVGESGSGKSVLTQSILKLIPSPPSKITSGEIIFQNKNLVNLNEAQIRKIRGRRISIIFQDAMTALNPTMKIGDQITESLMAHFSYKKHQRIDVIKALLDELLSLDESVSAKKLDDHANKIKNMINDWLNYYFYLPTESHDLHINQILQAINSENQSKNIEQWIIDIGSMTKHRARDIAISLLTQVKIPEAKQRLNQYIFQFSGGMRQRIMIAIALACKPEIIIADEPTTALDVTIKSEILDLLSDLKSKFNITILLITHDLGIVAAYADRIGVMYAGSFVEMGSSEDIFYRSKHPYTRGLLNAIPRLDQEHDEELSTISGNPPNLFEVHNGCRFVDRCAYAMKICALQPVKMLNIEDDHQFACHLADPRATQQLEKFYTDHNIFAISELSLTNSNAPLTKTDNKEMNHG